MLEITNLCVSYGDHEVVHRANLSVESGTITAILGPNGSGKTTLLRAVCGLLPSTSGSVVLDGTDITRVPAHKRGIGMLFQNTSLFPSFDVTGNVAFGLRTTKPRLSRDDINRRVDEVLEMVDMHDRSTDDVTTLSGGQCRRVDIARVLAPRPRALLLDEPMSMLDAATVDRVIGGLRNFVKPHSIATLCITHDKDEAAAIGDRVVGWSDIVG